MDMPLTTHQLDALSQFVSNHTKLSRRAFKKAITKGFGFATVGDYEHHLDKSSHLWAMEQTVSRYKAEAERLLSHFELDPFQSISDADAYKKAAKETTDVAEYMVKVAGEISPPSYNSFSLFKQVVSQCDTTGLPDTLRAALPAPNEELPIPLAESFNYIQKPSSVSRYPIITLRSEMSSEDITWLWALHDAAFSGNEIELQWVVSDYLLSLQNRTSEIIPFIGMPEYDVVVSLLHLHQQPRFTYAPMPVLLANAFTAHIPEEDSASRLSPWLPTLQVHRVLCWYDRQSLHATCQFLSSITSLTTTQWKGLIANASGFNKPANFINTLSGITFLSHTRHCDFYIGDLNESRIGYIKMMMRDAGDPEKQKMFRLPNVLTECGIDMKSFSIPAIESSAFDLVTRDSPEKYGDTESSTDLTSAYEKMDNISQVRKKVSNAILNAVTASKSNAPFSGDMLRNIDPRTRFYFDIEGSRSLKDTVAYLKSEEGRLAHPISPWGWRQIEDRIRFLHVVLRAYYAFSLSACDIINFIAMQKRDGNDFHAQAARLLPHLVAFPAQRDLVPRRVREGGAVRPIHSSAKIH